MSMNTANTESNKPAAKKPRAPRKPRAAKTAPDAAPAKPETPAEKPANAGSSTVDVLTKYAILGCMVIVTLPPAWKFNVPDRKPYFQIEVKDTQGNRYSDTYRITDKERAKALAEKIAKDRGIPLKVYEYVTEPEPTEPAAPATAEEPNDADDGEPTPF